jgi:hypothetical protein
MLSLIAGRLDLKRTFAAGVSTPGVSAMFSEPATMDSKYAAEE